MRKEDISSVACRAFLKAQKEAIRIDAKQQKKHREAYNEIHRQAVI